MMELRGRRKGGGVPKCCDTRVFTPEEQSSRKARGSICPISNYVFKGKWILLSLKMMVIHWNTFVFYFCIFENKTLLHAKRVKFQLA